MHRHSVGHCFPLTHARYERSGFVEVKSVLHISGKPLRAKSFVSYALFHFVTYIVTYIFPRPGSRDPGISSEVDLQ